MPNTHPNSTAKTAAAAALLFGSQQDFVSDFSRRVQREVDNFLENQIVYKEGWYSCSDEMLSAAPTYLIRGAYGMANANPSTLDIIDAINGLAGLDPDKAKILNNEGFGKTTTFEGHRLLNQFYQLRKLTIDDLSTGVKLVSPDVEKSHFSQIVKLCSECTNIPLEDVSRTLKARFQSGDIYKSERIRVAIDPNFSFNSITYIWAENGRIGIHCSSNDIKDYAAFRRLLKDTTAYADAFSDMETGFSPNATRVINGEEKKFKTLWFPEETAGEIVSFAILRENTIISKSILDEFGYGFAPDEPTPDDDPELPTLKH